MRPPSKGGPGGANPQLVKPHTHNKMRPPSKGGPGGANPQLGPPPDYDSLWH
jgi:hypothetical protein